MKKFWQHIGLTVLGGALVASGAFNPFALAILAPLGVKIATVGLGGLGLTAVSPETIKEGVQAAVTAITTKRR